VSGLVAGLGAWLLGGPFLALLGVLGAFVLVGVGYGLGRRSAFRHVDRKRASYQLASQRAARERVPAQRAGEL
jgi:membrane protein DedA with SNARE-associated domain